MTSSRLPGKALMPIAGVPSAVLVALRAANAGARVVVATSDDASDDPLVAALTERGVAYVRGSLSDVLSRFVLAATPLPDDAIVVRLTADNVLPDGRFVLEIAERLAASGLAYLGASSPQNRLPYGIGAEAFRAGALREAHATTTSAYDREHVTPWIRRKSHGENFRPASLGTRDFAHLRCTIDDQKDYERIARLFLPGDDPVHIGWLELAERLAQSPAEPRFRIGYKEVDDEVHGEMALGTVQLGVPYGITNRSGQPSREDAVRMVHHALAHGVTALDTARGYGEAEDVVGAALQGAWRSRAHVVTKLDPLAGVPADASAAVVRAAVAASVKASCAALGSSTLATLLLHRWAHRTAWGGAAWEELLALRAAGVIGVLGASVYDPDEALQAVADRDVAHLQIPFNVLDKRWKDKGVDAAVKRREGFIVHARSALLQGILAHGPEAWPRVPGVDAPALCATLAGLATRMGCASTAELCFSYARAQDWITSVVVGCDTLAQLTANLSMFRAPKLSKGQAEEVEAALPALPETLLNPAKWEART
jgi:aryl-alcohol dehydrogenase-like predicted oxidoreductase/spore coat polysaccharide biosynthesis protein SpsF (cytidylyltransferase family)